MRNGIGVQIDWNGTLADGPNHPGVPRSWWESLAKDDKEQEEQEQLEEVVAEPEE